MLSAPHLFQDACRLNFFLEAFESFFEGFAFFDHNFGHACVTSFHPV